MGSLCKACGFGLFTSLIIALAICLPVANGGVSEPTDTPTPVKTPDTPVGEQLVWVLEALSGRIEDPETERFAPEFVRQLPSAMPDPKSTAALQSGHTGIFGSGEAVLISIEGGTTDYTLRAILEAKATGKRFLLQLSLDPESGLINGLLITPAPTSADIPQSWSEVDDALRDLPGELSVLVASVEGEKLAPVFSINPDKRLGIGSAFKLWVLGALAELVHDGEATWDEPLALDFGIKTMPIGELRVQANREGMGPNPEFPLSRFADLMISISDNPATDHLIERVGRDRIIEFMSRVHDEPSLNQPFLSTGQFFKLKRGAPDEVLQAYIKAETPAERQAILDSEAYQNAVISIPLAMRWQEDGPVAIDSVEWFASARELGRTMLELRRLEQRPGMEALAHALRINDGINLDDQTWPSVAFKGGSEPGVLNLTYLADGADGKTWFVSLGWNNTETMVEDDRMIHIALGIFALLADSELPAEAATDGSTTRP
jgi:hypothetical protein